MCYAYLSDVSFNFNTAEIEARFRQSKWFTRGWTLQELIAPQKVEFYSVEWAFLGSKKLFANSILRVTNIDTDVLLHPKNLKYTSVAKRMSWASSRETTRQEDIAYCLLGIFGVHMTFMYGERDNAFTRLQEEIIKQSADQSIFAWSPANDRVLVSIDTWELARSGLLATHPYQFSKSSSIVPTRGYTGPYTITNQGIQIPLRLIPDPYEPGNYTGVLACHSENTLQPIGITLKSDRRTNESIFFRDANFGITFIEEKIIPRKTACTNIMVAKTYIAEPASKVYCQIRIANGGRRESDLQIDALWPAPALFQNNHHAQASNRTVQLLDKQHVASISVKTKTGIKFFVTYGTFMELDPYETFLDLRLDDGNSSLKDLNKQKALNRLPEGRRAALELSRTCTVKALLSWQKVLDQEVLIVDIWARHGWREILADFEWRQEFTTSRSTILKRGLSLLTLNLTIYTISTVFVILTKFIRQPDLKVMLRDFISVSFTSILPVASLMMIKYFPDHLSRNYGRFARNRQIIGVVVPLFIFLYYITLAALYFKTGVHY